MSDASILLLRLGFLALLWVFVLLALGVLRGDLATRAGRRPGRSTPRNAPRTSTQGTPTVAPAAVAATTTAAAAKPRRGAPTAVVIVDGDGERRVALGTAPVTFGRSPDNTVVLGDDYASGHHCRLVPTGKGWQLEDLGSTNGTTMGTTRVTDPIVVKTGSRFTIGRTEVSLV
jgi:pSer/pThr/pTyr-binding forkhead associated (FHA) protein